MMRVDGPWDEDMSPVLKLCSELWLRLSRGGVGGILGGCGGILGSRGGGLRNFVVFV
jgi:hypothetical protein